MTVEESKPEWEIGSIVALKSHPYSEVSEPDLIYISGEPQLISPLMVVTEILKTTKSSKRAGEIAQEEYQYKCTWYSDKTHQFEENWMFAGLLKIIKSSSEQVENEFTFGTNVEFKTSSIELGKKKATLKQTGDHSGAKTHTITALLSFVSPVMQVLSTNKPKQVDESKDKTIKKFYSKLSVKCKYYNVHLNKFSEVHLPIEALEIIQDTAPDKILKIKKAITDAMFLVIKDSGDASNRTKKIVKPTKISFRNGRYHLNSYNYLKGSELEKNINEIDIVAISKTYYNDVLPKFEHITGKLQVTQLNKSTLEDLIKKIGKDKFIQISYEDINEVKTSRVINDCEIIESDQKEMNKNGTAEEIIYLKAYCHLRNAERFFRIDRIRDVKVLDLF